MLFHFQISKEAKCRDAVAYFLDRKISCLAVVDEQQHVVGVLSKQAIMHALAQHPQDNYLAVLDLSVKVRRGTQ